MVRNMSEQSDTTQKDAWQISNMYVTRIKLGVVIFASVSAEGKGFKEDNIILQIQCNTNDITYLRVT